MRRLGFLLLLVPVLALAQPDDDGPPLRYLIGVELQAGPSAWGQSDVRFGAKPMAALQWGRLRISNSGAGALLGRGEGGGASAELLRGREWRVSAGLRLDRGRKASTSAVYADLPDVPGTLRGRLSLTWRPNARHSGTLAWLPDLRDKGVGDAWTLSLGRMLASEAWGASWGVYASLYGGDARHLRAHFGVPAGHPRYTAYAPGPGLRDLRVGLTMQRRLDEDGNWLLFGQLSASQLLGPAARAPFVRQRLGPGIAVGIAYRS